MKKIFLFTAIFLFVLSIALSAYSKSILITKNTILTLQDHTGGHFLVLKIEECSLGSKGEVFCAMKVDEKSKTVHLGPEGGFWDKLALNKP